MKQKARKGVLHPDIVPIFDSLAAQFAESLRDALVEITVAHPGKMSLPNDAFVLLEMAICNVMIGFGVPPGTEARLMKTLSTNVVQDLARHRLRTTQGSA